MHNSRRPIALVAVLLTAMPCAAGQTGPRLNEHSVVALVKEEMRKTGGLSRYNLRKPSYQSERGVWRVDLRRKGPPYVVDGDLRAEVNDRTGKVCIRQTMTPPVGEPCA